MRGPVIFAGFFTPALGCTNVLGIDGDYVLEAQGSGTWSATWGGA